MSGTLIIPIFGSIVQKGKFALWAFALDKQLKELIYPHSEDLLSAFKYINVKISFYKFAYKFN